MNLNVDCVGMPGRIKEICQGTAVKANGRLFTSRERAVIVSKYLKEPVDFSNVTVYAPTERPSRNKVMSPIAAEEPSTGPSTVGTQIREVWEKEIGYRISCNTCLEFLRSLDTRNNHVHERLVNDCYANLPFPETIRAVLKPKQRKERLSELLLPIVPKKATAYIPTPANPIEKATDKDWAVVVTTAPRQDPTIETCLESIRYAGWEPVIFTEPDSTVIEGYSFLSNTVRLGAWHNWLRSMRWALDKTTAKYILSVQDDSLFHPDSRAFIERIMWPSSNVGFISLYTAKHYSQNLSGEMRPLGVNRLITANLWGACALVFPRDVVYQILDHPLTKDWTGIPPKNLTDKEKANLVKEKKEKPWLIQNVDSLIGRVLNGIGLEMWCVDPSPVQHISQYSSIGHANNNTGKRNCLRCADHNKPLDRQVFP
jgi:hypothetical protein